MLLVVHRVVVVVRRVVRGTKYWCFVITALGWIWLLGVCVREIFMSIVLSFNSYFFPK